MLRNETATSPARRRQALAGLRAYQAATRPAPPPPVPAAATAGRARLLDYAAPGASGPPIVFVPSLINPPMVLDLSPANSLLRWLAGQGLRPMLVDWGAPDPADADADIARHVERLLLPLLATLSQPPILVGYCLGGTIALAAAHAAPVAGLALIAAPWHFTGAGQGARATLLQWWRDAEPTCRTLGLVPMELLQAGFWQLDPARTIAKFERFATLTPGSPEADAFVLLEDWANAGAPLSYAAGRQLFCDFYGDDLPGTGRWQVGGSAVDPTALRCPTVEFIAQGDRIVPAATAPGFADQRAVPAGHVGMVVGSRARALLWQPLADWCSGVAGPR